MINIIHPDTQAEWEQYYKLRYDVLRKPWDQPLGSEKDENEETSIHLFALMDEVPAGVCRIQYNSSKQAQIRFMGVDEKFRGHKIGHALLEKAENIVHESGHNEIVLQARENAVKFYESAGYSIVEKSFLLWNTIQHYLMRKSV
jgi:predicted GNAT family N-acyltransferase